MGTLDYSDLIQNKGPAYKDSQIVKWSHYRDPINKSFGRPAGNSRVIGDASYQVQAKAIDSLIAASKKAGLNNHQTAYVLAIARVESGFNPDAAAGTTSAYGLGQFTRRTGEHYGINAQNMDNIDKQAEALVAHYKDNLRLALHRGHGEEYIYKYHHDGPSADNGGLEISKREVMPYVARYEAFVEKHEIVFGNNNVHKKEISPLHEQAKHQLAPTHTKIERAKQNQTQAQNLHSQANKFCRAKIAELNMKWDAGMEKTVHAMTALAFKHDLKNIDSFNLSKDLKTISFADNNSGQKLHLSSGIAAETSIEQSQNNISKVSAERQNLSTNLAIPAKLRSLLADKNLSEQQLQNVAANVQVKTPNANYAAQDIAIKDGNLLVLYRNSECKEAAVGKEINLQQAIQTPAEQTLAQQNQQQVAQTPNHDGPTPNHDGPTLKL